LIDIDSNFVKKLCILNNNGKFSFYIIVGSHFRFIQVASRKKKQENQISGIIKMLSVVISFFLQHYILFTFNSSPESKTVIIFNLF